ncbi:hypothetical protein RRU94_11530 [Domibacillus sp. DTU_2020_1001157_1_SI_ALB_TIR_016]|uniref:hypothetical protein n=1 Tax=Domibacillus sp. DTU_2020_1001157_1_SI_ALB_TIR_016 TaxID=3077789 RepID=UPI0028E76883|nr:hypothetical protein [Domibacillus sp. DTU_2020_1001157_1_SI_ALB_TIR_016]WNS81423.1 hypothetical protein RRU94_11530 [Domibacillus sp. DTU_2020_1001157_1_SI_ALB_TIR_016]
MIVIPMNAFGEAEVKKNGQAFLFKQLIESDIKGVEIRRELLTPSDRPLEQFQTEHYTVYSAPVELFQADGTFNKENLQIVVQEMTEIKADTLKLPLGSFMKGKSNVKEMDHFFRKALPAGTQWLVENDQTKQGGTIEPLAAFLEICSEEGMEAGLTFDTGNWRYTGESVQKAFHVLKSYIRYLHVKQVNETPEGLQTVAIPLGKSAEWEMILELLPAAVPVALEFPLSMNDLFLYKNYIEKKKAVVQ